MCNSFLMKFCLKNIIIFISLSKIIINLLIRYNSFDFKLTNRMTLDNVFITKYLIWNHIQTVSVIRRTFSWIQLCGKKLSALLCFPWQINILMGRIRGCSGGGYIVRVESDFLMKKSSKTRLVIKQVFLSENDHDIILLRILDTTIMISLNYPWCSMEMCFKKSMTISKNFSIDFVT